MKSDLIVLPDELRKNGYSYILLDRNERFALYGQLCSKCFTELGYEVFKITIQRERTFNRRYFPRKERSLTNEDFGKTAWSISNFKRAYTKYVELSSK